MINNLFFISTLSNYWYIYDITIFLIVISFFFTLIYFLFLISLNLYYLFNIKNLNKNNIYFNLSQQIKDTKIEKFMKTELILLIIFIIFYYPFSFNIWLLLFLTKTITWWFLSILVFFITFTILTYLIYNFLDIKFILNLENNLLKNYKSKNYEKNKRLLNLYKLKINKAKYLLELTNDYSENKELKKEAIKTIEIIVKLYEKTFVNLNNK